MPLTSVLHTLLGKVLSWRIVCLLCRIRMSWYQCVCCMLGQGAVSWSAPTFACKSMSWYYQWPWAWPFLSHTKQSFATLWNDTALLPGVCSCRHSAGRLCTRDWSCCRDDMGMSCDISYQEVTNYYVYGRWHGLLLCGYCQLWWVFISAHNFWSRAIIVKPGKATSKHQ